MNRRRNDAAPDVKDWIRHLIVHHIERFPRADWPLPRSQAAYFDGWIRALRARQATQEEAEAASMLMMEDPPDHIDHHLSRLLKIIEGLRDRAASDADIRAAKEGRYRPAPNYGPSDPEAVALLKRFCAAAGPERVAIAAELAERAGETPWMGPGPGG